MTHLNLKSGSLTQKESKIRLPQKSFPCPGQTHNNPFTSKTKRAQVKESQQKRKNESAYGKARLVRTLRGLELGLASLALSECSFSRLLFLRCLIFSLRGSMQFLHSHPFCLHGKRFCMRSPCVSAGGRDEIQQKGDSESGATRPL